MNNDLEDELTSINSIYEENTLELVDGQNLLCILRPPTQKTIGIRLEFPDNYPDAPPSILGTESVGVEAPKGMGKRIIDMSRDILSRTFRPGEPCIFELIEELNNQLETETEEAKSGPIDNHLEENLPNSNAIELGPEPPWSIAEPITEKKSAFLSRSVSVTSPEQAKSYLHHLLATDKKVTRATHNITAWRIRGFDGTSFQDCDDDGETAAGGRMLHLLQLMDVWDVMVVVTRWYGGVKLGPDRFRIINNSARDALIAGGFTASSNTTAPAKKGKK
jgi:Uncharacterized protein family UPF0029/RWD domain